MLPKAHWKNLLCQWRYGRWDLVSLETKYKRPTHQFICVTVPWYVVVYTPPSTHYLNYRVYSRSQDWISIHAHWFESNLSWQTLVVNYYTLNTISRLKQQSHHMGTWNFNGSDQRPHKSGATLWLASPGWTQRHVETVSFTSFWHKPQIPHCTQNRVLNNNQVPRYQNYRK